MTIRIYLDFDGVLVDSAFEAFRIACAAFEVIDTPQEDRFDDRYSAFLELRKRVAPAWNYYYVMQEMFLGDSVEIWTDTPPAREFEKTFFRVRNEFQQASEASWLSLHKLYFDISWLNRISYIDIITNKPKLAVQKLLKFYGCPLLANRVFDRTDWPDSTSKASFINKNMEDTKVLKAVFVDDHPEIVNEVNSLSDDRLLAFHAEWGYSDPDERVRGIDITGFRELISGYQ